MDSSSSDLFTYRGCLSSRQLIYRLEVFQCPGEQFEHTLPYNLPSKWLRSWLRIPLWPVCLRMQESAEGLAASHCFSQRTRGTSKYCSPSCYTNSRSNAAPNKQKSTNGSQLVFWKISPLLLIKETLALNFFGIWTDFQLSIVWCSRMMDGWLFSDLLMIV